MRAGPAFAILLASTCAADAPALDAERYLEIVKTLSAPSMRGRGTGSAELDQSAEYLAGQFRAAGLAPAAGDSFFLPFPVATRAKLGDRNRLSYRLGDQRVTLRQGEQFLPFSFSASARIKAGVVFAGYGISAPEYGYDDYNALDVRGKAVIVLRHEPQEFEEKSVFVGRIYTEHAQFFSKAVNARAHGAAAVLLVHDLSNHSSSIDELEKFSSGAGPADAGIPYAQLKTEIVDAWLARSGKTVRELGDAIDRDLRPRSFEVPGVSVALETHIARAERPVRNVAAYLPGDSDEYVIVGAHYDHLGMGEQFSMAPEQAGKSIHPGADDNASGTAGVVELARRFAQRPRGRRGVLFLCFAGEELGLLGSSFYVHHPALPAGKAVAMINLDMIGRMRDGKLIVGGAASGSGLNELVERTAADYPFHLDLTETSGYGSSDHTSFTTQSIPALFFFTGLHADYHRPSDTWDKIDAAGTVRLLDMIGRITLALRDEPHRRVFVRPVQAGKS
jgi:hypothetical protein